MLPRTICTPNVLQSTLQMTRVGSRSMTTALNRMDLSRYELPQWSMDRHARKNRPRELAMWDKLQQYPIAKESTTMTDFLKQQSIDFPFEDIYTSTFTRQRHDWPFPQLAYLSRGAAAGFLEAGYKKGQRFLTWCDNGPELLLLLLAAPQAGVTQVAIPPNASVEAVKSVLLKENIRTLFFDQRCGNEYRLDQVQDIFPPADHPSQTNWIVSKRYRDLKQFVNVTGEDEYLATMTFRSFPVFDPEPHPVDQVRPFLHADDPMFISYRFGKSRDELVKGEELSTNALFEAGKASNDAISLSNKDRVLSLAPMWEKFGVSAGVFGPLQVGCKVVHGDRGFGPQEALDAIDKQRPSTIVATADQLQQMADYVTQSENKNKYVLSSVVKGLIDVGEKGTIGANPFSKAKLLPVDSKSMQSSNTPFKLA